MALDKVLFGGNGEDGNGEGFWIEFGSHGKIRAFSLVWPELQRNRQERTVSPDVILRCIRAFKTSVLPAKEEPDYFGRLKALSGVKRLTITKITPYYGEGRYGEQPSENEPEKFIEPVAALDAVADWGNSNAPVRLFSPLIASDADRLLAQKAKKP